jgi:hypothetical protein
VTQEAHAARPVRQRVRRGPGHRHWYLRRPRPGTRLDGPGHRHPRALDFFDQAVIEKATGSPVRSQYSKPGAPRSQIPDAIIVALASYNTINKWALGISDTYALGVLAETTGLDVPIVVLPFVNSTLVGRESFRRSAEGVRILPGPRRIPAPKVAESAPIGSREGYGPDPQHQGLR